MTAIKKPCFLLLLLSLFVISLLGYTAFREKTPEPRVASILVRVRYCDNALADAVEEKVTVASIDGAPCKILSLSKAPSTVTKEEGGALVSYPSRLFSDLSFRLFAEVTVKDGMPYAEECFLSVGKKILLSSPVFYGECEILSIDVD